MNNDHLGKIALTGMTFSHPIAYYLIGQEVVGKLFGFITVSRVTLDDVHYLRLATSSEVSPVFMLLNITSFMSFKRTLRPVYILQARKKKLRMFLKMEGGKHFRLRQAIARHTTPQGNGRMAA